MLAWLGSMHKERVHDEIVIGDALRLGKVKQAQQNFFLDLYVNADYTGLYGQEDACNPDSIKSRTGYILLLNSCPVV